MKITLTAVIPVKENSSRLPGKNFLPFANSNSLLEHKIRQLQKVPSISEIIVSSDSDKAFRIASAHNVKFIKRPLEYANETKPLSEFFRYIANILSTEHMLWACVTSPLIDNLDFE